MDFYLFFFLFVFHKEFLVISHNFNDQVYTIIIAQPNLDNQIGAIERVNINPQPHIVKLVGWWLVAYRILVSAPVPLELILTGFDWVGAGPWEFGIWDGA